MFFCKIWEIFKNFYFEEYLQTTAFDNGLEKLLSYMILNDFSNMTTVQSWKFFLNILFSKQLLANLSN